MTKKQKKRLTRILVSSILLAIVYAVCRMWGDSFPVFLPPVLYLIPYLVIGWDVVWEAIRKIARGRLFDEQFLMTLATVGAFAVQDYPEAAFVMLFFQIGELFESIAVGKSRRSISALTDICPDTARVLRDGTVTETDPEEITVGDLLVVRPGDRIPTDGVVTDGTSELDTSALTGESEPVTVTVGDGVVSGCICLNGALTVRAEKPYGASTVAKILELVENSGMNKAKSEKFITRFSKYYTPAVVIGALLLAVVPSVITRNPTLWIRRAMTFLVISCPCALVISVPLAFFGGVGGASRLGVLFKGSDFLETVSQCDTFVFDKTGTLTQGRFSLLRLLPAKGIAPELLTEYAAAAECRSSHPIGKALSEAYGKVPDGVTDVTETAGHGVSAVYRGHTLLAGSRKWLEDNGVAVPQTVSAYTLVFVSCDSTYIGCAELGDIPKPDAKQAIADLRTCGVARIVMLTGDRQEAADRVAGDLGIDEVFARLLPGEKSAVLDTLRQNGAKKIAFVGDGINDAPAIAAADVGIAMGSLGSDAAVEAADVVLMDDKPSKLADAIKISQKTGRIVRQNIIFSLAIKFSVLIAAAFGLAGIELGVFADVGVCVLAILNSMRTLRSVKK